MRNTLNLKYLVLCGVLAASGHSVAQNTTTDNPDKATKTEAKGMCERAGGKLPRMAEMGKKDPEIYWSEEAKPLTTKTCLNSFPPTGCTGGKERQMLVWCVTPPKS